MSDSVYVNTIVIKKVTLNLHELNIGECIT